MTSQPDITFFGEQLADDFDNLLYQDREEVDLLIVIGTSLKVRWGARMQILLNIGTDLGLTR
jgi:NAD-dependent SIR2 family protein deacetylase